MTKEKLVKLERYLLNMQQKLESGIPAKHQGHPETYTRFLRNEIASVKATLEQAKLEGAVK